MSHAIVKKTLLLILIFYTGIYAFSFWQIYSKMPAWKCALYYIDPFSFDEPEIYFSDYLYIPKEYFFWVYEQRSKEAILAEEVKYNSMATVFDLGIWESTSEKKVARTFNMLTLMKKKGLSFNGRQLSSTGCSPLQDFILLLGMQNVKDDNYFRRLGAIRIMIDLGSDLSFSNPNASLESCQKSASQLLNELDKRNKVNN